MNYPNNFRYLWTLKQLWRIPAPFIVPILLIWEKGGRLPAPLFFATTPDELLPGDLTIPKVRWIYDHLGRFATSWYWIGWRNVGHGITWRCGKPVPKPIWFMNPAEQGKYGLWEKVDKVGIFYIHKGWKTVPNPLSNDRGKPFWAIPRVSIRFSE